VLTTRRTCIALLPILYLTLSCSSSWSQDGKASSAVASDPSDHGTFELFSEGKSIGTEKFEIRVHSGQVQAHAEIHLRIDQGGKTVDARTTPELVMDSQLHPLSYTWDQKGLQSSHLTIDFSSTPVHARYKTVNGEDDVRDFKLPKDVVVLDDNVLHHYQLLLDRADLAKAEKQVFQAFVPQEALPGVVTIESAGAGPVTVGGASMNLQHFVLTTELAHINLWVDGQHHLQFVSAPEARFEGVRKP